MDKCPRNEAEFIVYFFNLIGRKIGEPADDWVEVMSARYPWKDKRIVIPEGLRSGQKPNPDAPFYGLTQQWSGGPKARLFIPSTPDNLGYYARQIQYLKRVNPDGVFPTHVWDWKHTDGNDYTPICEDGEVVVPPTSDLEARVKELERQLDLIKIVAVSKNSFRKVALRSIANGRIICAELGQDGTLKANRDHVQSWEEFEIIFLD